MVCEDEASQETLQKLEDAGSTTGHVEKEVKITGCGEYEKEE